MSKDYKDYFQDILSSMNEAEEFVKGMNFEFFINDRKTVNAVVRSLEVIGEAAKNIPQTLKDKYPQIPWKKMSSMRDRLIHEYFGVDYEIVWQTIHDDFPYLKLEFTKIVQDL